MTTVDSYKNFVRGRVMITVANSWGANGIGIRLTVAF